MFPGAGASVHYNGAGEPLGWDYPTYEPEYFDCCGNTGHCICDCRYGDHEWIDALTGDPVDNEDLDRVREERRWNHQPEPLCVNCKVRYDPVVHGEPLED